MYMLKKKMKPAGPKPWLRSRRRKNSQKDADRLNWKAPRWMTYMAERAAARDRPRRPKRMALRLTWTAERDAEAHRQKRNAELYPARRARMIALNAKRREERAQ